jgi:Na+-driven multidrug efflux pump
VFGVKVPLSYILVLFTPLSILSIFAIVNGTLLIKSVIGGILVKRGKWAINLVEDVHTEENPA